MIDLQDTISLIIEMEENQKFDDFAKLYFKYYKCFSGLEYIFNEYLNSEYLGSIKYRRKGYLSKHSFNRFLYFKKNGVDLYDKLHC